MAKTHIIPLSKETELMLYLQQFLPEFTLEPITHPDYTRNNQLLGVILADGHAYSYYWDSSKPIKENLKWTLIGPK
jgi:YD repeat-containing protein